MTQTARLRLPQLAAAQAQKHVTVNEALTMLDTLVHLSVLDKDLTAPPSNAQEGDAYIVAAGATGAWSGWDNRIARRQDGTWRSFLPGAGEGAGWMAFVQDEGTVYVFDGAEWTSFTQGPPGIAGMRHSFSTNTATGQNPGAGILRLDAASLSAAGELAISHADADGLGQGGFVSGWREGDHIRLRRLGVSAGFARYRISGAPTHGGGWSRFPVAHVVSGGGFAAGDSMDVGLDAAGEPGGDGQSFAPDAIVEDESGLDDHASAPQGFVVLVIATSAIYVKLSVSAGDWSQPVALRGANGTDGGLPWRFDAATDTAGDPGSGALRLNHSDPASASEMALSAEVMAMEPADVSALLARWATVDNPSLGTLRIVAESEPQRFADWRVGAIVPEDGFARLSLDGGVASATFAADETVRVHFTPAAERGETGPAGPNTGLDYRWSQAVAGDPGTGRIRADHPSPASAGTLSMSILDRHGTNHYAIIEAADDSTNAVRGHARLVDVADRANWAEFAIVGDAELQAGWYDLPVEHVASAGVLAEDAILAVTFARSGDAGEMSGPAEAAFGQPAYFGSVDGNTVTGGAVLAPPVLDADADDYAPSGLSGAVTLRLEAGAPRRVTGLAGGADRRAMTVRNAGTAPVTLADEDAASAAANRFALGGRDMVLRTGDAATLHYDGAAGRWAAAFARPTATDVALVPSVAGQTSVQAALERFETDPWLVRAIGEPVALWDDMDGVDPPPTDRTYRYVLLTAGEDGSGGYNEGILTGESVSGSAPDVAATAQLDLPASPLHGETIRLINTERRILKAGGAGTVEGDAIRNITGSFGAYWGHSLSASGAFDQSTGNNLRPDPGSSGGTRNITFDASFAVPTADENRPRNVGVTYYMRVL